MKYHDCVLYRLYYIDILATVQTVNLKTVCLQKAHSFMTDTPGSQVRDKDNLVLAQALHDEDRMPVWPFRVMKAPLNGGVNGW